MKHITELKMIVKTSLLSAIFTVLLLILVNYFFNHSWNLFSTNAGSQLFTVSATSTINQTPDQAQITFTVTQTTTLLQDAQNQANKQTNTIVSDLQKIGIARNDIQTSNYSSDQNSPDVYNTEVMPGPAHILPPETSPVPGYTVSEDITVTLHDITKTNGVIDTITKDGAENVSGPNLTFSDATQQSLISQARVQAILEAKQKAQSMAEAAGIRLGRIVNIQENNPSPYLIRPMMAGASAGGGQNVSTQINPGENTVSETVTLSYETW